MKLPIDFPDLNPSDRDREFSSYDPRVRGEIIHHYLTQGNTHRELDEAFLGLDKASSRGWQSMGILHFVGLRPEHSQKLRGWSISDMIEAFQNSDHLKGHLIAEQLSALRGFATENTALSIEEDLSKRVSESRSDTVESRRARLAVAAEQAATTVTTTTVFRRNPDVIAEVLDRAQGHCEHCKSPAPFMRRSDGTPYLEIHHTVRLADGGPDTVENAVALCPNCHRKAHFG